MIVYNVTIKIDSNVETEWLDWMQSYHIPDVLNTGCFEDAKIQKLLGYDDEEGMTYSVQYRAKTMEDIDRYQADFAPKLQKEHTDRYKDRFVAFRTLLDEIQHFNP